MQRTPLASLNNTAGRLIDLLLSRRSTPARTMEEPGPNKAELLQILTAAARVPDHGKLVPWRFIILQKDAQLTLGDIIAESIKREEPQVSELTIKALQQFASQAPLLIAVISTPKMDCNIPVWEQHLSAGAACQNLLLASASLDFAVQWLTGQAAYSPGVHKFFDMGTNDRIAGFIFIGSQADRPLKERPRPALNDILTWR